MLAIFPLLPCGGIGGTHGSSTFRGNSSDVLSLVDFKNAITGDPNGALRSWNAATPFCQWSGVVCSSKHPGRVTALDPADTACQAPSPPPLAT